MKAAVLYKANTPLEVVDVKQEDPRPGEARVKVTAAGVCHSDWHIMNGDWTVPLPMVLGHEAAGIVEEVGAGVTTVKPGDHVSSRSGRSAGIACTARSAARSCATATTTRPAG